MITLAKRALVAISTMDYRHLDADLTNVRALVTPLMFSQVQTSFNNSRPILMSEKGITSATVTTATIQSQNNSTVQVLATLVATLIRPGQSTPRTTTTKILATLARQPDGQYLLSEILLQ